eukprot:CAMPEP_0201281100 /NCGR_PEP_ID=MMETSP1317-20130820/1405_1 /ASSEMBLY_ACC=CAM_ASM_000770 /TAXON_ID=187299 /ORGANISM="Undescribed Undescribed, Strain Undescribed" /LENGTH=168 /DNA_ID=CAMNT_0047590085 /DNA_START=57 /DNA_END=563 /DNA_ORIENTATION=+
MDLDQPLLERSASGLIRASFGVDGSQKKYYYQACISILIALASILALYFESESSGTFLENWLVGVTSLQIVFICFLFPMILFDTKRTRCTSHVLTVYNVVDLGWLVLGAVLVVTVSTKSAVFAVAVVIVCYNFFTMGLLIIMACCGAVVVLFTRKPHLLPRNSMETYG